MSGLKLTRRSANYTAAEVDCLLSYLEANPEVAFAKVGGVIQTPDDYRTAWEVLAEMVTKAGPVGKCYIRYADGNFSKSPNVK